MPYTEVRFLDVDYGQTEDQYDKTMELLRKEIDEENELLEQTKQLEAEVRNLQATMRPDTLEDVSRYSGQIVPAHQARLNEIKQQNATAKKRRHVVHASAQPEKVEAVLQEVGDLLNQSAVFLTEREEQSELEAIRRMLQELDQNPTPAGIDEAESKLEKLAFSNEAVQELWRTFSILRQNQAEKQKIKNMAEKELEEMWQKMEQMREKYPGATKEAKSKKRKKGQQQQAKAAPQSRKEEIHELRKNVRELQTVVLPALATLTNQLVSAGIQSPEPEQQTNQAAELVQTLTVS
jgi:DNA repair exonuclease SbcCD ATPase subunit